MSPLINIESRSVQNGIMSRYIHLHICLSNNYLFHLLMHLVHLRYYIDLSQFF